MTQTFKIQIVEDELLVALDISERLKHAGYEITDVSNNMNDAVAAYRKHMPDLILLDVTIKGKETGIDTAIAINEIQPVPFIYITAHADAVTVHKAKNTSPAAYLVKPYTTNALLVSIELALHNFACKSDDTSFDNQGQDKSIFLRQNHVYLKDGYRFVKLFLNDILYFAAEDNYIRLFTTSGKIFLIRNTLTKVMDVFKSSHFVRIHKSYCINTNHIDAFSEQEVTVNGNVIPVGRNYKGELLRIFNFR